MNLSDFIPGCNITATFFVSHKYTDYQMVESLRHWRHEIADHTITHRTPISWWKNATYEEWKNEITGQREILRKFGHIEQETVKGFRAPYLQLGGNNQYKALWDSKFLYDSSIPTTQTQMWPYTFDYKSTQECNVKPPCPTGKHVITSALKSLCLPESFAGILQFQNALKSNLFHCESMDPHCSG